MESPTKLPLFTLLLLISFASVNAVLFTPALPNITQFFSISANVAQQTITWFLIGYALGQLLYGPIANRFGRKPALYAGITVQIISSLLCAWAGSMQAYWLLVLARFLLALGSGVGLKITYTLVNECYTPRIASQKISYLILAFGVTPGLSVALGGVLNTHFGWASCFYASALYGVMILLLVTRLPETQPVLDLNALKIKNLLHDYAHPFKNKSLLLGGLLMGCCTCFSYIFAALGPFIAITLFGMSSAHYGLANIIPPIGLVAGSVIGAQLPRKYPLKHIMATGIAITCVGVVIMFIALLLHTSALSSLFLPLIIIYFGLCLIIANASSIAMSSVENKAHGAAVMSFMNMSSATAVVLSIGALSIQPLLLPLVFGVLCFAMVLILFFIPDTHATKP